MKTTLPKADAIKRKWWIVDAKDLVLGRLSVKIANVLRGRHKAIYTPHIDTGDYVVVINAEKVRLTGNKEEQKDYMFYTGYFGNEKHINAKTMRQKNPKFLIENAVKGMLPKNKLSRQIIKKMKVFVGDQHDHEAQQPETLSI